MLSCDVTKREVSSSFSMVAAWLRRARLADEKHLALLLPRHRPWTGEREQHGSKTRRRPATLSPSFRSSLGFPWRLNRTCASLWRQPLAAAVVVVVCVFVEAPPFPPKRFPSCGLRRLIRHLPFSPSRSVLRLLWVEKCLERGRTIAAGFDRRKSRDISQYTGETAFPVFFLVIRVH